MLPICLHLILILILKFIELLLIDRLSLTLTELGVPQDDSSNLKYIYIDFLNYLLFQTSSSPYKISVLDVSTKQIINSFSSTPQQGQLIDITDFQFDYSLSSCLMYMDRLGNFYLSSLDKNYSFQNYITINEFNDPKIKLQNFYYNNITNDIFIYYNSLYSFDLSILGQPYDPQLNEPYNLFSKIFINNLQVDYLIFNKYNNTIFRYTKSYLKFELDISGSRMVDMLYNQELDILVIALEDSILFYQQYQFSKFNNMLPNIYKLDNIHFQQFIADNLILTYDQQILHLNIQNGIIANTVQFNSTQLVTSYSLNKKQDLLLVGFSDKQVLLYNLVDKQQFVFWASFKSPLSSSIIIIQFIETEQVAYAVSSDGTIIQINTSNKQQIQQIDLKNLVNEDTNATIVQFLVDETYKRYIFCFLGQKKAYVWNYSQQLREQYLFLPSIQVKKLKIEQNYILISCAFQINIFYLDTSIRFFTVIKKNFIKDKIIDYYFVSDKVIAIFFIDKFELFLIQGENFNLVSQQNYSYPKILDYHFDSSSNSVKIIGMHQNGIFENNYNLDTFSQDQIQECTLLISNSQIAQVQQSLNSVYPKQIQSQSINGIFLIDQQNYQSYVYLQIICGFFIQHLEQCCTSIK
ncbi:hypothetical protein TTHERM_00748950 (macronuclear) [Tetrahymena thermophila SB210]|uniref:Uncharacterized protein n=1 Tax=Tetrahymena thermophila (strain SB210) TaxID=312017 RepID=Q239T3_TETTS|nr:hypothetical protein TTHERM_00748950 [Tetrahymena thermophila SB210]EAR93325.2 hypothetical protein TTHERM_00748950 [Tetrahymena thermophila SB210]|eukprot:XP_001013570.2 hypothetical protein TTHERM_00748950 [Tetrahymena thermophila SB210]